MKLTNLAIIFSCIAIIMFLICDTRVDSLTRCSNLRMEYDKRIDSAVDDGIYQLVELDSNREIVLNKEMAVEQFYHSLFANFGVIGHSTLENDLKRYIPIIVIVDTDGFYINYSDVYVKNGDRFLSKKWTEKIPFVYEDERLIYNFSINDYVKIYDKWSGLRCEGVYHDLKSQYPDTILSDDTTFDRTRRNTIVDKLEVSMKEYINHHNKIAESFGITYQFSLPQIDKSEWYRTIDDISLLVLFQGYPFYRGVDFYNRFSFGGARISKARTYYMEENKEDGKLYYHKASCPRLTSKTQLYYTKEECALEGGFPCPYCVP